MDRYPVIVWIGAAILGRVGGEMIMTDPLIERILGPSQAVVIGVEILCAVGVLCAGRLFARRARTV